MTKLGLVLALLVLAFEVQAGSLEDGLVHRVVIPAEDVEMVFDVIQKSRDGVRYRESRLSCLGSCDDFEPYSEETLDNILSVQFDSDNRSLVFVTWVTGSAYRVQAFSVSGRGFKRQIEIGSRAAPVVANLSGKVSLVFVESEARDNEPCLRQIVWSGTAFSAPRPVCASASLYGEACQ